MTNPPTAARLLTGPEELALARRIERGDLAAKRTLIEANVRLVRSVAAEYRGLGVPLEDLVQEGSIGLVRAAERFDHRRGLRFSTYATWWIRQAVVRGLAQAQPIRLPASAGRRLRALRRAGRELSAAGGREPTIEGAAAAADAPDFDHERLRRLVAALPPRQRTVVELSFGLAGRTPVELPRIARSLGVSTERARQLRSSALLRLREGLEGAQLHVA
jgi:RNA polymerase primary sigma factor